MFLHQNNSLALATYLVNFAQRQAYAYEFLLYCSKLATSDDLALSSVFFIT